MEIPVESQFKYLEDQLRQKHLQVQQQIQIMQQSDPIFVYGAETAETGTFSWQSEVHDKNLILSNKLKYLSSQIEESLDKIHLGTYGRCNKCGELIDFERLLAYPTAAVCTNCL